jgi:hypothetical protein
MTTSRSNFPMDRDQQLEAALAIVESLEPEYEKALLAKFDAESDYKTFKAKAFLEADGTEKKREAESIVKTEKYLRERNRTEAVYLFLKEKLADAQNTVSARQSLLNSNKRTNAAFTG